jgi:hypothetical protein
MNHLRTGLLLCMMACYTAGATRWQTSSPGYWRQTTTWMGQAVPPYTSGDTFIITYPVIFDQSLVFNAGAYVQIEAGGGLCGHQNVTMHAGSYMLKYGLLELDTMYIPGGHVLCKLPKEVIFSRYGIITNGGSLTIDSCGLAVGPWFQCKLPEYHFQDATAVSSEQQKHLISLFPNPNNGSFILNGELPQGNAILQLTDVAGRCVHVDVSATGAGNGREIHTSLPAGLYYWRLMKVGECLGEGRVG